MRALHAAGQILFYRNDEVVEEWSGGWLPLTVLRKLDDGREYLLAVGVDTVMLFVDHPDAEDMYVWILKQDYDTMEDAADFLVLTREITSLADFMAMGFEQLQRNCDRRP